MIPRIPLVAQVIVVLGLNVLLVIAAVVMVVRVQDMTGYAPLLHGRASSGLRAAATGVAAQLADSSPALWDAELEEASAKYGVTFLLVDRATGNIFGNQEMVVPTSVLNQLGMDLFLPTYGRRP